MNEKQINSLKEKYPKGTQIVLKRMSGENQMPCGLKGTVTHVDDAGQIHMKWENGSSLALNVDEDTFEKAEEKISVVLVEVGKVPRLVEIENTLEAMQSLVGGNIEEYMPFNDEVAIVCNEEGKMRGLSLNRAIYTNSRKILDVIAGDFFVAYAPKGTDKFQSMPEDLAKKYEEYFKMVIRDTSGHPTYELFDGIGKYYIAKILSKEASICPHVTRVIAKIAGDATKQATIKDIAGNKWPKEQIDAIWPIEDVYAQATLDEVYEILYEMDLGGCLTTDETIRNYVIDMVKAGSTVAPLLESIEKENAEYFYKDFNDWSTTPAVPLYSAIDMIKAVI